ncbi:hypothetical protein SLNHY_4645 [Streptomyces albus]|nr:hypothetical protein SLNHY_4645 [Streptomyces albus]
MSRRTGATPGGREDSAPAGTEAGGPGDGVHPPGQGELRRRGVRGRTGWWCGRHRARGHRSVNSSRAGRRCDPYARTPRTGRSVQPVKR